MHAPQGDFAESDDVDHAPDDDFARGLAPGRVPFPEQRRGPAAIGFWGILRSHNVRGAIPDRWARHLELIEGAW